MDHKPPKSRKLCPHLRRTCSQGPKLTGVWRTEMDEKNPRSCFLTEYSQRIEILRILIVIFNSKFEGAELARLFDRTQTMLQSSVRATEVHPCVPVPLAEPGRAPRPPRPAGPPRPQSSSNMEPHLSFRGRRALVTGAGKGDRGLGAGGRGRAGASLTPSPRRDRSRRGCGAEQGRGPGDRAEPDGGGPGEPDTGGTEPSFCPPGSPPASRPQRPLSPQCPDIESLCLDLADWEAVEAAVGAAGPFELLVNNAAVAELQPFLEVTRSALQRWVPGPGGSRTGARLHGEPRGRGCPPRRHKAVNVRNGGRAFQKTVFLEGNQLERTKTATPDRLTCTLPAMPSVGRLLLHMSFFFTVFLFLTSSSFTP